MEIGDYVKSLFAHGEWMKARIGRIVAFIPGSNLVTVRWPGGETDEVLEHLTLADPVELLGKIGTGEVVGSPDQEDAEDGARGPSLRGAQEEATEVRDEIKKGSLGHEWELQDGYEERIVKCLHCDAEVKVSASSVGEDGLVRRKLLAHNNAAVQPCQGAHQIIQARKYFRIVEMTIHDVKPGDIFFAIGEEETDALLLRRCQDPKGENVPHLTAIGVVKVTRPDLFKKE
jgi:hypothetical protein